jgi:hypothetical protein
MLRFLSRRGKGRNAQESPQKVQAQAVGASGGGSPFHQQKNLKLNKNCLLCKVIVLDGTDLSIELPVRTKLNYTHILHPLHITHTQLN